MEFLVVCSVGVYGEERSDKKAIIISRRSHQLKRQRAVSINSLCFFFSLNLFAVLFWSMRRERAADSRQQLSS